MRRVTGEGGLVITDLGPPDGVEPRPRDRSGGAKRLPPDVRRKMLLDAARGVIAERGLHATTVRDVAAAGGVAVGTVTYHFSSIQEMLAGVLENEMETYSADIWASAAAGTTGLAGLTALIDGLVASDVRAHEHWKLWLDFWALAAHYPQYSTWQSRVYRDLHQLTSEILSRGVADKTLSVEDPAGEAVEFIALLDGLVVQSYLPESRLTPSRARAILHHYVRATMVER